MKSFRTLFILAALLCLHNLPALAVVAVHPGAAERIESELTESQRRRLDKKMAKIERKMERRKAKGKPVPSVWDDGMFRLGVLLVLGGIAVAILASLLSFGFFGFIAGLLGLAGIILLIWALAEYYA